MWASQRRLFVWVNVTPVAYDSLFSQLPGNTRCFSIGNSWPNSHASVRQPGSVESSCLTRPQQWLNPGLNIPRRLSLAMRRCHVALSIWDTSGVVGRKGLLVYAPSSEQGSVGGVLIHLTLFVCHLEWTRTQSQRSTPLESNPQTCGCQAATVGQQGAATASCLRRMLFQKPAAWLRVPPWQLIATAWLLCISETLWWPARTGHQEVISEQMI